MVFVVEGHETRDVHVLAPPFQPAASQCFPDDRVASSVTRRITFTSTTTHRHRPFPTIVLPHWSREASPRASDDDDDDDKEKEKEQEEEVAALCWACSVAAAAAVGSVSLVSRSEN
ncbi:hypothetical protein Q1695_015445 [Nippostrongylus brasiliensis]|nr:hypothetical protein Q1695_015445 [Nippostrongylus brasiliensis]